jgi:predicted HTH transcriptional regulator
MARLLMNMLQFEFNLIPTIIHKEDKEEYIKALVATREEHNLNIFREFMTSMMERNLAAEIDTYLHSIGEGGEITEKTLKSRDKIIALLSEDGTLSAKALSTKIGITPKAVEKHLARLKADGIIERIGPARGGYWRVR